MANNNKPPHLSNKQWRLQLQRDRTAVRRKLEKQLQEQIAKTIAIRVDT